MNRRTRRKRIKQQNRKVHNMAFTDTPTLMIASYASDDTTLTMPRASFPELSAAEAHTSTGDSRKILFALCERFYQFYNALAADDLPGRLTIQRTTSTNDITGDISRSYQFNFTAVPATGGIEVKDEPA